MSEKTIHFIKSIEEASKFPKADRVEYNCTKCGALASSGVDHVLRKNRLLCTKCATILSRQEFMAKKNSMTPEEYLQSKSFKYITSLDETKDIPGCKFVTFNCIKCGKLAGNDNIRLREKGLLLCGDCMKKHTNMERFGYESAAQRPEAREKASKFNLEHKDEINQVRQDTNLKRFGKTNYMCYGEPEYMEMMISKYLDDLPDSRKTELVNMNFSDFSYVLWNELPMFKSVATKSMIDNNELDAETDNISYKEACSLLRQKHPEWLEKTLKTFMDRYHTTHPTSKPIYIDGMSFDSDWEVYVYIYYRDHGSIIIREPKPPLMYFDLYGGDHKYYPDFMIDGRYVEVKGTQFFKDQDPTKEMISAYVNPEWIEDRYRLEMDIAKCKGECIKQNTFLISKHNIKMYKDYFFQHYDNNWIESAYYRNALMYAFSRFTFKPLYCNSLNGGKGVTPFDLKSDDEYTPITDKGITPFDIMLPKD